MWLKEVRLASAECRERHIPHVASRGHVTDARGRRVVESLSEGKWRDRTCSSTERAHGMQSFSRREGTGRDAHVICPPCLPSTEFIYTHLTLALPTVLSAAISPASCLVVICRSAQNSETKLQTLTLSSTQDYSSPCTQPNNCYPQRCRLHPTCA